MRLRPEGILWGESARRLVETGAARPLVGGPAAFTLLELVARSGDAIHLFGPVSVGEAESWAGEEGLGEAFACAVASYGKFHGVLLHRMAAQRARISR